MKWTTRSKDGMRGFVLGVLLMALAVSAPAALALTGKQSLDVVYNDIKLVVDGREVTPKDVNGNTVEPFSYKGTTYLPVRAAVNAITGGTKNVEWEQSTATIYIGDKPTDEIVDMATLKAYSGSNFTSGYKFICRQETYEPFNALTSSIHTVATDGGRHSYTEFVGDATYLLNGDYETFHAWVAVGDEGSSGTVMIKDKDTGAELASVTIRQGEKPVELSADVIGVDKVNISLGGGKIYLYNATLTKI